MKDEFEDWYANSKWWNENFQSVSFASWQACAKRYEAQVNALLAVNAEKDKALKTVSEHTLCDWLEDTSKKALALTPEKVRLVKVGEVETVGGYPDTSQQLCYLKKYANDGTKLYAIEVTE